MFFVLGGLLALIGVIALGRRLPWEADPVQLGYVSERWLAEYRASHSS